MEIKVLDQCEQTEKLSSRWTAPVVPSSIPTGDMPGDKVKIEELHIKKATSIFPAILDKINPVLTQEMGKVVLCVCGGSGVGKSEIASLLSYYFNNLGIGCYTLSGDNYPHRIPKYNDAERLHVFRESAIQGMVKKNEFTKERFEIIHDFQIKGDDANPNHKLTYPWYETYLECGKEGLKHYLGTKNEIGFEELEEIIKDFKSNKDKIWLRRMGREDTELWYEEVDFTNIKVLVIEWTHGNSDQYQGVDFPILLNSTPQETLEHRRLRNRDGATDSPFTTMVLELEQQMLMTQAHKAQIIVSKNGELLDYNSYCELMNLCKEENR